MNLSDLAIIKTHFPDADFWVVRRGSRKSCGQPTRIFNCEHIGIKVVRTDLLLSDYLFYVLYSIHQNGDWEPKAVGTTNLVNIKTSDVKRLKVAFT